MERTASEIRRACAAVLAEEKYEELADGTTFCNLAVHDILTKLRLPAFCLSSGTTDSRPMLANDLAEKLETHCRELNFEEAHRLALDGAVVIAALKMPEHGHVAVVYPVSYVAASAKWGRSDIPMVANVGKDNAVMPANWAFGARPRFWLVAL